jgi:LysM repeat protein
MKQKRISLTVIFLIVAMLIIVSTIFASNMRSGNANKIKKEDFEYTVQHGDTCRKIASAYDVSVMSIIVNNGLKTDCSDIFVGQVLKIIHPTVVPIQLAEPTTKTIIDCLTEQYTVTTGDTLESISSKYKASKENIADFNGLSNNNIYPGMQLVIPLCPAMPTP